MEDWWALCVQVHSLDKDTVMATTVIFHLTMGMAVTDTDMDLASVAIMEGTFDMVDFRHVVIQFFCADTMADTAITSTDTDIIMVIIDETDATDWLIHSCFQHPFHNFESIYRFLHGTKSRSPFQFP
ncbi:hypothetical protein OUZ56_005817 [Daphnia magna]|uniref:Uncharacterized protein n=1 Tax=Daphnia magna TaxID=35525 RepID=A0ABQ9YTW9_9CRUS|nr:hypothetical protein OUZ56_005817 [Daphnia magna]